LEFSGVEKALEIQDFLLLQYKMLFLNTDPVTITVQLRLSVSD